MANIQGTQGQDTLTSTNTGDTLTGGLGDDTYIIDDALDIVVEQRSLQSPLDPQGDRILLTDEANSGALGSQLSMDGRYLLMATIDQLVSQDTNIVGDVYIKDLQTNQYTLISTSQTGTISNDVSAITVASTDLTQVFFISLATNLVNNDTNGVHDLFVKNTLTGAISRVNTDALGAEVADAIGYHYDISNDGRYVVFSSASDKFDAGDTNQVADVFVKDMVTGSVRRASVSSSGAQTQNASVQMDYFQISADGNLVAFNSSADDLVVNDTNQSIDVFVKNLTTGALVQANTSATGEQANAKTIGSFMFSADGSQVLLMSEASNLVAQDNNQVADAFLKNLNTGAITRVNTNALGEEANAAIHYAILSPDATKVVFASKASNLIQGDTNNALDVFYKDLITGQVVRLIENIDEYGFVPTFSADGFHLIFNTRDRISFTDLDDEFDVTLKTLFGARSEGVDTIQSSVSYQLPELVENLTLLGTADLSATGNQTSNILTGNSGQNVLIGGGGDDTLIGGLGIDTADYRHTQQALLVNLAGQIASGDRSVGFDTLQDIEQVIGGAGADTLIGDQQNNRLDGHTGADFLNGRQGNDTYVVDHVGDVIQEMISTSEIKRVSTTSSDQETQGANEPLMFTADSQKILFMAPYNFLDHQLPANRTYMYLKNLATNQVTMIGHGFTEALISSDERFVVFNHRESVTPDDLSPYHDLYIHDVQTGIASVFTKSASGDPSDGHSILFDISTDGQVLFSSEANNLVSTPDDDTYLRQDLFIKNLQTQAMTRIEIRHDGIQANNYLDRAQWLGNAAQGIVFESYADNLVANDTNGESDIFIKDFVTGDLRLISQWMAPANGQSDRADVSADGKKIMFFSYASNLVNNDTNGIEDIFVKDMNTGLLTRVNTSSQGVQANGDSSFGTISPDGRFVAFVSSATNLVHGDTNGVNDLFVKDLLTGEIERVNMSQFGLQANNRPIDPVFANDSRTLAFSTVASNLVANDLNNRQDIFVVNLNRVDAGGIDTVEASIDYSLGQYLEHLTLTGSAHLNGTGNGLSNTMVGNSGNNILTAGLLDDQLDGQAGNDTLYGGGGVDRLDGGMGNDRLDGGSGADRMSGGEGDDAYWVNGVGDQVIELANQGTDTVHSTINYTLTATNNLENIVLLTAGTTATGNLGNNSLTASDFGNTLNGGGGNDILIGGAGGDRLNGGTGIDQMTGGNGNDTYVVNGIGDRAIELINGGVDTVESSIAWTLADHLEHLTLTGSAQIAGTGNQLANTLTGNAGNNQLEGLAGDDRLIGGLGNDTYVMRRTYGAEVIEDVDSTVGNQDRLNFVGTINENQLWLTQAGDDLQIQVIGTLDRVTIDNWYSNTDARIELIQAGTGKQLTAANVQNLVNAMSSMTPPPMGQTSLTAAERSQLNAVISANWQ